ncbi:MAG TPA: ribonuclease P protein component [Candidatus Paceibacterota bacterium]|nr:ribonuclease P protein component [Candidatus Paceibacterota bacterium]
MAIKITRLPSSEFRAQGYRTVAARAFLVKTRKTARADARIGIVAGKAVHAAAVKRNFWKRQARAAAASLAMPGSDILIVLSGGVDRFTKKQFREAVSRAMEKIK